ncbi:hypothetical protein ABAC460_17575 [Asticcacaulis sp. AC460]|nr:hypothetical protein ABAC460_17575 [Asticcacaulis sp. AC460]
MRINLKLTAGFRDLEYFLEPVTGGKAVCFSRLVACRYILELLTFKRDFVRRQVRRLGNVLIDETLAVKLAKNHLVAGVVEVIEPDVLMEFSLGIFRLRQLGRLISNTQELPINRQLVGSLDGAVARVSVTFAGH